MGAYDTLADREHTMIIDSKITILQVGWDPTTVSNIQGLMVPWSAYISICQ